MDYLLEIVKFFIHIDQYLEIVLDKYGMWTYLLLFLVIFAETGLVVTPFLPGDSLIFVVGTFAARGWLSVLILFFLLISAGILGNTVNYIIGGWVGPKVFEKNYRFLNKKYLMHTQNFFDKYGGKAVIVARFLPIVRTFAPFLAGVARMSYTRYTAYNVIGSVLWVSLFLFGGYFFGNIPFVKENLTLIIIFILILSVVPTLIEFIRRSKKQAVVKEQ